MFCRSHFFTRNLNFWYNIIWTGASYYFAWLWWQPYKSNYVCCPILGPLKKTLLNHSFCIDSFCENIGAITICRLHIFAAESPVSVMLCVVMRYADDIQHVHNNFRAIADNLWIVWKLLGSIQRFQQLHCCAWIKDVQLV